MSARFDFPQVELAIDILVAPLRANAVRLSDMRSEEIVDLMSVVEKAQAAVEKEYGAKDSTISLQDGVLAGRSVDHLHVHVLPRKTGDFKHDNDVYDQVSGQLEMRMFVA